MSLKRLALAAMPALMMLTLSHPVAQAGFLDTTWVREYNGSVNGVDRAAGLQLDAEGNVYVTGMSEGDTSGFDITTLKYDSSGVLLWERRYNGPGNGRDSAVSLIYDGSGSLYLAGACWGGASDYDVTLLKYDTSGNLLWERHHNGAANLADKPTDMTLDATGNIYLTGHAFGFGGGQDYLTLKYDSDGTLLWQRTRNGTGGGMDTAMAVCVGADGSVYVTGTELGLGTFYDIATVKYNAAGIQQWVRTYNGPGNVDDRGRDLAVDDAGYVYVAGGSWGAGTNEDYTILKYDPAGALIWERRYDGPTSLYDRPNVLQLDAAANVYVTGGSDGFFGHDLDFATLKYDSAGTLLWESRFNGLGNGVDIAAAMHIDAAGNVYIGGKSDSALADYMILKYDADGQTLYHLSYSAPDNAVENFAAFAIDAAGSIHVTGTSRLTLGNDNYATVRFPSCSCRNQSDSDRDGFVTAVDMGTCIDIVFFGAPDIQNALCWTPRFDFNCDSATTAVDLAGIIDLIFFSGPGPCVPCEVGP